MEQGSKNSEWWRTAVPTFGSSRSETISFIRWMPTYSSKEKTHGFYKNYRNSIIFLDQDFHTYAFRTSLGHKKSKTRKDYVCLNIVVSKTCLGIFPWRISARIFFFVGAFLQTFFFKLYLVYLKEIIFRQENFCSSRNWDPKIIKKKV